MASNTWRHAVYTVGPSGEKIFVDGSLIHHRSGVTSSSYNWDQYAYIGWSTDRGYFNGQIDEVKIYDNELSQAEVSELYNGCGAPVQCANSLQAHYTFDGHWSATTTGSHNWATSMSGSSYGVAGQHDTALNFDGNDRIQVNAGGAVSENNFGISLWFKTSNTNAGGLFCVDYAGHDRHFGIASDRIYIRTWPHGSQHPGTAGMASNTWRHAVYTVGPSGEKIFVDGSLIHHRSGVTSSSYNWDQYAYIGWSTDRGYFNGQIDDVKIYDNELDQTEVSNLYSGACV